MENYQEKARENFYRNRPYGIHIDYARKGFVLFNHYTNSLGKQETGSIEGLPLEKFEDVDAIPLNGKIIKNGETFSFCKTLGPSSTKNGYQEADIFDNARK